MLIIKNSSLDPCFNLAVEEVLLKEFDCDIFSLWQNENAVIVGKNQNTANEINREFIEKNSITVVRRLTGGGAVYHDKGNLNFTFISRNQKSRFLDFEYFNRPIIKILKELGFNASHSERNDILVDNKKISGTAQTIYKNAVMHHGTLLISANLSVLSDALNPNPLKITSKAITSVKSRVANLCALGGEKIDVALLKTKIEEFIRSEYANITLLSADEDGELRDKALKLRAEKYSTYEWNYGYSPSYSVEKSIYCGGGLIETKINILDGKIADIKFYGDFSGLLPASEFENLLKDCEYTTQSVKEIIEKTDINYFFMGAFKTDILKLICL